MNILLGLPLRLLALGLLLLRFLLPLLVILVLAWLLRRRMDPASRREENPDPPLRFDGPVYTVDYEEVEEKARGEEDP